MPITTLQRRLTQVGVIRLGVQTTGRNGRTRPAKLETLRFTSPSKKLIEAVAAAYGGEVKPWKAPSGPQWEVITDAKEIPVLVPPQRIDPNMEHWGNGYRDRLCDGATELIRKAPCLCAAADRPGKPGDVCKPTTRMSVMLAEIPSLGTWKIESHGWNAAAELPTLAASIESAPTPIPARLEVQRREKKDYDPGADEGKQVESRVFMVPVLHFEYVTPAQAFGGQLGDAARAALTGSTAQQITADADPGHRKFTPAEYLVLTEAAEDIDHVRELWRDAAGDDALTDAVAAALHAKVAKIEKAAEVKTKQARPQPAGDVVDAEVVDGAEVWAAIQQAAGERGWSADDLERRIQDTLGVSSTDADGFALTRFHDALRAGDVA
jgi:hypothetical protein